VQIHRGGQDITRRIKSKDYFTAVAGQFPGRGLHRSWASSHFRRQQPNVDYWGILALNLRSGPLRSAAIAALIALLACFPLCGQSARASICVVPISDEKPTSFISPGGTYNPATLSIKIDNRDSILWPHKENLKIGDLDVTKRHLLQVISDGKRIQSIWFRFSESEVQRCVSFDSYHLLNFDIPEKRCKCK
jgi:hypothetical protein